MIGALILLITVAILDKTTEYYAGLICVQINLYATKIQVPTIPFVSVCQRF